MIEDKNNTKDIVSSIEKISDSKGLVAIGDAIGIGLVFIGIGLMIAAIALGSKWDGHLNPQEKCFEVKQINDETYQVNNCTGEMKKLILK